jgi:hypothetical protein
VQHERDAHHGTRARGKDDKRLQATTQRIDWRAIAKEPILNRRDFH